MRRVGAVVFLAVALPLLAACSASSAPSTSTSTTTTTSSDSGTSSTGSSTSSTSTSSTSTSAGPARCAVSALSASLVGSSGAAGTIEATVALRNASATLCALSGYPGLQLLDSSGTALPTMVVRKGTYSFTAMAPAVVTLAAGQSAYFNLGYSDVPVGQQTSCPTSTSLEVTPPNAYDQRTIAASLAPCGGGTIVVSPVFSLTATNTQTTAPAPG